MTLSEFWKNLERQARPVVEAELAKLGWKLTATKPWSAVADHGRPLPRPSEIAASCSAEGLIEKVREIEAAASKTCCEGECPECATGEGEP